MLTPISITATSSCARRIMFIAVPPQGKPLAVWRHAPQKMSPNPDAQRNELKLIIFFVRQVTALSWTHQHQVSNHAQMELPFAFGITLVEAPYDSDPVSTLDTPFGNIFLGARIEPHHF